MSLFAEVVVSTGTRVTDQIYTYSVPENLVGNIHVGLRVVVPFGRGNRERTAIVLRLFEQDQIAYSVKEILHAAEEKAQINQESIALAKFLIDRYLSDFSSAFRAVLPPGKPGGYQPVLRRYYRISEEGLQAAPPLNAKRQHAILNFLRDGNTRSEQEIRDALAITIAPLRALCGKGWLICSEERASRRTAAIGEAYEKRILTEAQQAVYDRIVAKNGFYLLRGVTGSGKTEIYLQLVEKALSEGKQAIVLVPEISLTPQTIARFEGRFGQQVAILHSRLTQSERAEEWEKIACGKASIAIGARSVIFAPFRELGVIIVDEEHESSYVSDQNPKYHTNAVAAFRAQYHNCPLVLGSATPSIETLYQAEQGRLTRLDLPERVGNKAMPQIQVVDMREELKKNNRSMFSLPLQEAISDALRKKQQVILLLNKRGHTSFVFCRRCGYVYRCDACDVAMTYHKGKDRLVCHYCGREKARRKTCPQCGSNAILEFGAGTEMLEEETRKLFPKARIVRADADTMRTKGSYQKVYQRMLDGSIDILLGTQMIAKGFDFPNVTVVGIVSADITLNLPDFRAQEKAFQLVTQTAGRAGRGDVPGKVFVQTYKPEVSAIVEAAHQDVDGFYRKEIRFREENGYPPFVSELIIRITSRIRKNALEKGQQIRKALDGEQRYRLMRIDGPSPCVMERIDGRYRFAILVRSKSRQELESLGRYVIRNFPGNEKIHVVVTIDPVSIF
ncbi:MAG: primosomal protein N' [Peptoniphilaceae bacterium]|nr:primosomal protein N' [Peptoniphilaceae bacterium]